MCRQACGKFLFPGVISFLCSRKWLRVCISEGMRKIPAALTSLLLFAGLFASAEAPEQAFPQLLAAFEAEYTQQVRVDHHVILDISQDSENPLYFGGGSLEERTYSISVGRDILSLSSMTVDAQAFLLCHEVGHLVGGEPRKNAWASTEGQSDFYAASECLRRIFPHLSSQSQKLTHPVLAAACAEKFQARTLAAHECERIGNAGESLIFAIYDFMGVPQMKKPDFSTPAPVKLPQEKINYPTLQCRLDTVLAGALQEERPACWF